MAHCNGDGRHRFLAPILVHACGSISYDRRTSRCKEFVTSEPPCAGKLTLYLDHANAADLLLRLLGLLQLQHLLHNLLLLDQECADDTVGHT